MSSAVSSASSAHAHAHARARQRTPRHADGARGGWRGGGGGGRGGEIESAPGAAAAAAARAAAVTSGLVRRLAEALAESFASSAHGGGFRRPRRRRRVRRSRGVGRRHRRVATPRGAPQRKSRRAARAAPRRGFRTRRRPWLRRQPRQPRAAHSPPVAPSSPSRRRRRRARGGKRWRQAPAAGSGFSVRFGSAGFAAEASSTDDPSDTTRRRMTAGKGRRMFAVRPVVPSARARDARGFRRAFGAGRRRGRAAPLRALRSTEQQVARVPGTIVAGLRLSRRSSTRARPTRGANSRIRRARDGFERPSESLSRTPRPRLGLVGGRRISRRESHRRARGDGAGGSSHASRPSCCTRRLNFARPCCRTREAARALPADFVPVAATVLRLLNATARFGPRRRSARKLHGSARGDAPPVIVRAGAVRERVGIRGEAKDRAGAPPRRARIRERARGGSANAGATAAELADLLDQTVLFIGAFALLCPANQDMLCWGRAPRRAAPSGSALRVLQLPREDRDAVPHARRGGVSTRDQRERIAGN